MTCIYVAWEEALRIGHENVYVRREPIFQPGLFDEYIPVDADMEKVHKVVRSIKGQISYEAYSYVYYATLSTDEDVLQIIYNFLRVGFVAGANVCHMHNNLHVIKINEIRRRVASESHHFLEFARFNSLDNQVYVCHLEPKSDVIMLVGRHFEDRMPSEHWMIIDDNRKTACVHPKDGETYLRYLTAAEFAALRETETYEDAYTDMWRGFFHAISIKERENRRCQRTLFPLWKRKHATEFMHERTGTKNV